MLRGLEIITLHKENVQIHHVQFYAIKNHCLIKSNCFYSNSEFSKFIYFPSIFLCKFSPKINLIQFAYDKQNANSSSIDERCNYYSFVNVL